MPIRVAWRSHWLSVEVLSTAIALTGLTVAGWAFLFGAVADMSHPLARLMMPALPDWTAANALAVLVMWWIMMAAMMVPSAAPMILIFARVNANRPDASGRLIAFGGGYLVAWGAFSLLATAAQWLLQTAELISPMLRSNGKLFTAIVFALAGAYQLTALKRRCLTRCRSPFRFLADEWRDGVSGALAMGLRHGIYCVGCCWALMLLLFAIGVMNLGWVAFLAAITLVEKLAPRGDWFGAITGVALIGYGAWRLIA